MAATASLAPPWSGPLSAAMAAVTAAWRSVSVEAATRAAKVEALNSCSAYRMRETSSARAIAFVCSWGTRCSVGDPLLFRLQWVSNGSWSVSKYNKFSAKLRSGLGWTWRFACARRCALAMRMGTWARRRTDFRRFASRESTLAPSRPGGAKTPPLPVASGSVIPSSDTPVLRISIGCALGGTTPMKASTGPGSGHCVCNCAVKSSSSLRVGSLPNSKR